MRDVFSRLSHRGNLVRRILTHAIVALVAIFLLVVVTTSAVLAATTANWNGNNISYDSNSYTQKTADGKTPPSLSNKQSYFEYTKTTDVFSGKGEASIIYFKSGVNMDTATAATNAVYEIDDSGKYGSKISGPVEIAITSKKLSASSTQAAWSGNDIQFDGRTYKGDGTTAFVSDGTAAPSFPKGTQYYQSAGVPGLDGSSTLYTISFPAGVAVGEQTTASYATFSVDDSGKTGAMTGTAKSITIVPSTVSNANPDAVGAGMGTSCGVEGIGWIVCPVSNFLAWGMDNIFNMLKGFLEVAPITTGTDSSLYQAWSAVRNIANIAFVIVFLIIIYSQVTNLGITNYGLKKLVPRLIVAAVLVNLSYIICAVAVDLSNIAGSGVQQIFVSLRESLTGPNTNSIDSWESVTGYVLAAGTAAGVGTVAIGGIIIASGASLSAALILLLPALLGLILAVLVALLVLAARQALIIIAIIIAPLAFVAYLLPNTEKLFQQWRGVFVTMLVFFPMFGLIFGGSQLAAFLIIQTAHDINVILLAMFVQVAPLVLTPLLVRFSGGIIGRIAGLVNDPKKGIIDRTRNWSKGKSELWAARNMARRDPIRRRQVFRRFATGADHLRRSNEDRLAMYKETADARWTRTRNYSNIQQDLRFAQEEKALGTDSAGLRYQSSKHVAGRTQQLDLRSRQLKLETENAQAVSNVQWDSNHSQVVAQQRTRAKVLEQQLSALHKTHDAEFDELRAGRLGNLPATAAIGAMLRQAQQDSHLNALNTMRIDSAQKAITERFTADLKQNVVFQGQRMQTYAGGIQGVDGAQRALAAAINAAEKASAEADANAASILSDANLDDAIVKEIGLGNAAGTGITITKQMIIAAGRKILSGKNTTEIADYLERVDINPTADNQDLRQMIAETTLANSAKPKYAGAGIMGRTKQGFAPPAGQERTFAWIVETINGNKLGSAEVLVTEDKDYLMKVLAAIQNPQARSAMSTRALAIIKSEIALAKRDARFSSRIAERRNVLNEIQARI